MLLYIYIHIYMYIYIQIYIQIFERFVLCPMVLSSVTRPKILHKIAEFSNFKLKKGLFIKIENDKKRQIIWLTKFSFSFFCFSYEGIKRAQLVLPFFSFLFFFFTALKQAFNAIYTEHRQIIDGIVHVLMLCILPMKRIIITHIKYYN